MKENEIGDGTDWWGTQPLIQTQHTRPRRRRKRRKQSKKEEDKKERAKGLFLPSCPMYF
jgi:hypothetical protein